MRVSHQHRIALAGIAAKNAKVHYVCDQLGHPETPEVIAWLRECDADIDPKYVSRIVRSWRKARGLLDTGEMAALTEEVLTELDAQQQHQEDEATVSEIAAPPIEPPAPEVTEPDSVQELAARVREAQGLLPLQADQALLTVLSEDELAAERALAEWERATDREIRRAAKAAELARVKREQATAETIAKSEAADARWHQRALSARRKLTSPHARLAQL
ncbi:hypothetical protein [Micrococcus luteus]|uniref:hypothetical protein n=2 Tax=Actinomycetes TaxID=1760 RepID=UPI0033EFEDD4